MAVECIQCFDPGWVTGRASSL